MATALQMQSTLLENGTLELALANVEMPVPGENEVLVRVEASPINPSDLGVMFGPADVNAATSTGSGADTVLSAPVAPQHMPRFAARVGQALTVGNEGAGVVVDAGPGEAAQALMGKTVAILGGGMYGQYRTIPAMMCLPLPDDATAKDGASCFVNPLTALAMVETMRMEDHKALVHTAAASNLGQMLNRICMADGVDLVNIVRKQEQVDILKAMGAKYICNSSDDNFMADLTDALHETGATIAFDATGGGDLASKILTGMEQAAARTPSQYSIYGSTTHKQVYLYGSLDMSATTLNRAYGMAWGVGGFLLPNFLAKVGMEKGNEMRGRVARELKTTFASNYTQELSLTEALDADTAKQYNLKTTGEKYLMCPQKDL
ncbi:zinc-binding dehydrogenase [Parasphingorhabdus sp.]|uniref:zinc-binding dehydrogenase n=1 Tax=Parasphingorhabdus sp. TaxID=2709688 RepID=UPI003262FF3C